MNRALGVLKLHKASNCQGRDGYSWINTDLVFNDAFVPNDAADIRRAIPERRTTPRNLKVPWYLSEDHLVDGSTTIEVNHMSQRDDVLARLKEIL